MLKSSKVMLATACLLGLNAGAALAGSAIPLPNGTVGTPYSVDLAVALTEAYGASSGNLNGWVVEGDAVPGYRNGLPPGEVLVVGAASPFDLYLSGTPTAAGIYHFYLAPYVGDNASAGYIETVVGGIPAAPEPATWALMLAGFVGVSIVGVRRTSAAKRPAAVA